MNIKELKEKIKDLPDIMDVMIEQTNDYRYAMSNEIEVDTILFKDDSIPKSDWAHVKCLVIRD